MVVGARLPISIAPAVEPAMIDRRALGRFFGVSASSFVAVAMLTIHSPR